MALPKTLSLTIGPVETWIILALCVAFAILVTKLIKVIIDNREIEKEEERARLEALAKLDKIREDDEKIQRVIVELAKFDVFFKEKISESITINTYISTCKDLLEIKEITDNIIEDRHNIGRLEKTRGLITMYLNLLNSTRVKFIPTEISKVDSKKKVKKENKDEEIL